MMENRGYADSRAGAATALLTPQPEHPNLHRRFEWHAAREPDALAVVDGNLTFTYAEINARANRLARNLIEIGVTNEVLVGVSLKRSHHFVVAVLAVLKAGGAYVPLDPEHPSVRTLAVAGSAQLKYVICHAADAQPINWPAGCLVIDPEEINMGIDADIESPDDPERLLYAIHTSGSTGTPKGVLVTHWNVARLFDALRPSLGFGTGDCWSFYHSPAFGYSAWEIWGALSQGGTLVIIPSVHRLTGAEFMRLLRQARVTVLSLTPSAFRHHLLDGAFDGMDTMTELRMIALSGEAPVAADLKKWFAQNPSGRPELVSTYAITETGGQVAWRVLHPGDSDAAWMGNVLTDTRVHILDEALRPVPAGTIGEICVAGPGLARGYLHQPELTREKFIHDPFGCGREERIYRTGDRARIRSDGTIELVGRADDQVKLSGHRIELGEIEAVLREHRSINEAAVILRLDNGTFPRLVAYVVAKGGTDNSSPTPTSNNQPEFWPSIGEYQVYDEVLYHFMTNEPIRTSAYRKALERHCNDRVVLDIGTGQDALLARYAAEAGARKVYAIEVIEDAAERARKLVDGLGLRDKITVLNGDSAQISLPEPVDVWTQGIIGNIGSSDGIIPIANDARRWMKPGAIAVPCRCVTYFAAVELPENMREKPGFGPLARQYAEKVFENFGRKFDVRLCVRNFPQSQLITDKSVFEDLDFSGLIEANFTGKHTFTVDKDSCFDGFILWTYVTTTEGVSVDFLKNQQAWLPIYFPMTDEGWRLKQGDFIDVEWQRVTSANGLNPDYHIRASVRDANGTASIFTHRSCHHEQSYMGNGIHRRLFEKWDEVATSPEPRQLRSHLARKLPDYMLPAAFVFLESLPRNANGKLDRRALPSPGSQRPDLETPHRPPENTLECRLLNIWHEVLGIDGLGTDDDFFALGGNSLQAIAITNRIQQHLGEHVYVIAIFDAPTVKSLARHLLKHYPDAISRAYPEMEGTVIRELQEIPHRKLQPEDEAAMRALLQPAARRRQSSERLRKNPRAAFILSTHRSGSTLFRIMLAGHPALFVPPELELLGFDSLSERRVAFTGRDSYWLEGTIRAIMQLRSCPVGDAEKIMDHWEAQGLSVPEFYQQLQQEAAGRLLIDKSTHYALYPETLRKAEEWFVDPLYIHLLRHPCGSINSYLDTRMEFFFRHDHQFSGFHLAELNWLISQRNILDFLKDIPAHRQMSLKFEDLVSAPQPAMEKTCRFLGLEFHPGMLDPYGDQSERMTDATYPHSKPLGDIKFSSHKKIDPAIAGCWRGKIEESSLGDVTWDLAREFGYAKIEVPPAKVTPSEFPGHAGLSMPPEPKAGPTDGPLPLSFAQQRIWFIQQIDKIGCAQNLTGWIHLVGNLDVEKLKEAIRRVVARHQCLRARFSDCEGTPSLSLDSEPTFGWTLQDLGALGAGEREAARASAIERERTTPFNLENGPLLRCSLLKIQDGEHILIRCFHHIATDGWSSAVFNKEISAFYKALTVGEKASLPPLLVNYSDFARWQRDWLGTKELEHQLAYWRETLAEASSLDLPADHPRPQQGESPCQAHSFTIPKTTVSLLENFSREEGVTPFMPLLATFQILLARHSGQDDILVGVPVAYRRHVAWEPLIGFFVNTLVLRTRFQGDEGFNEIVGKVREQVLAAFENQDVPFEKLVEELNPERELGRHPLIQAMFQLNDDPGNELDLPGINSRTQFLPPAAIHLDLEFTITRRQQQWEATLSWNANLFDKATMQRMAGHFQSLLESLLRDPAQCAFAADMLTKSEEEEILAMGTGPRVHFSIEKPVHELIDAHAMQRPEAAAFIQSDARLTYGQLAVLSNELARKLHTLGVRTESKVVLLLHRSVNFPVAVLAVMKCGGCFVPLAADTPRERVAYILKDTGAEVVVVQRESLSALPETKANVVCLVNGKWEGNSESPRGMLPSHWSPSDLAYVIYTSGSTGQPKGVMIEHKDMLAHFQAIIRFFALDANDQCLQAASLGFDAAILHLLAPLVAGSTVVMTGDEIWKAEELTQRIAEFKLSVVCLTPAYWAEWIKNLNSSTAAASLPSLRLIEVGADVLPPEAVAHWQSLHLHHVRLLNGYGPTEATISALIHEVGAHAGGRVPIGRPLANRKAYILNRHNRPSSVGVAGELCLGGVGVGRGYLNRPELTAAQFVADPFASGTNARMYRTGDMARFLPDGTVDFLGRRDGQVKIRGFRIELGEIDAVLRSQPGIQHAVTVVRRDDPLNPRLVSFLVTDPGFPADSANLRISVAAHLPNYMVPTALFFLASLPMTGSGKVDRKSLEKMGDVNLAQRPDYEAPRNDRERELTDIWQFVLSREQVGIHDNFFDLGGHSLLALRVLSMIRDATGVNLPIRMFFEFPTIATLANHLAMERKRIREGGGKLSRHLISLRVGDPEKPVIVLVPGGWGGDYDLRHFAEVLTHLPGDLTVLGVNMRVLDPKHPFHPEVPSRAKRLLKEVLVQSGERTFHVIAEGIAGVVAVEMARLASAVGNALGSLVLLESECPIRKGNQRSIPRVGPQWGEPDPCRILPQPVKRYYDCLRAQRPAQLTVRVEMVVSAAVARSADPSLGWSTVLPHLKIHQVEGTSQANDTPHAETISMLQKALDVIQPKEAKVGLRSVARAVEPRGHGELSRIGRHLACLQKGDGHLPPLVIFPGGKGDEDELLVFARLIRYLPPEQPVFGVVMRLMDSRCPYPASLEKRVSEVLAELLHQAGEGGFHALGECLAGVSALELVRQAREAHRHPLSLLLLDSVNPASRKRRFLKKLLAPWTEAYAARILAEKSLTGPDRHNPAAATYLKRYFRMLVSYKPEPIDFPLDLVCVGDESPYTPPNFGWDTVSRTLRRHVVPGDHNSYIREFAQVTASSVADIISARNTEDREGLRRSVC